MNGYSKISSTSVSGTGHKSIRSMDFSDFFSSPQTPKPSSRKSVPTTDRGRAIPEESPNNKVRKIKHNCSPERELDEGGGNIGERFGVILGRSSSVSSASGFQATMKRAFSMRRSSSVSERYCRIHDQYMATTTSPIGDEEIDGGIGPRRSNNNKGAKKIFKACKRLLGL